MALGARVKVAVTFLSAFIKGTHAPFPAQAADHPPNCDIASGVFNNSTKVLYGNVAVPVHDTFEHEIPPGLLVIVPPPFPESTTVMLWVGGSKRADIFVRLCIVVVQEPVPEQPPPDQPVKVWPELAIAVKVTEEL